MTTKKYPDPEKFRREVAATRMQLYVDLDGESGKAKSCLVVNDKVQPSLEELSDSQAILLSQLMIVVQKQATDELVRRGLLPADIDAHAAAAAKLVREGGKA